MENTLAKNYHAEL